MIPETSARCKKDSSSFCLSIFPSTYGMRRFHAPKQSSRVHKSKSVLLKHPWAVTLTTLRFSWPAPLERRGLVLFWREPDYRLGLVPSTQFWIGGQWTWPHCPKFWHTVLPAKKKAKGSSCWISYHLPARLNIRLNHLKTRLPSKPILKMNKQHIAASRALIRFLQFAAVMFALLKNCKVWFF